MAKEGLKQDGRWRANPLAFSHGLDQLCSVQPRLAHLGA